MSVLAQMNLVAFLLCPCPDAASGHAIRKRSFHLQGNALAMAALTRISPGSWRLAGLSCKFFITTFTNCSNLTWGGPPGFCRGVELHVLHGFPCFIDSANELLCPFVQDRKSVRLGKSVGAR